MSVPRRRALARAALLAAVLTALAIGLEPGDVGSQQTSAVAQPVLGLPLGRVTTIGSGAQVGETWAYGDLGNAPATGSDGQPVTRTDFALARHVAGQGWRIFQGANGGALAGFNAIAPGVGAGRVTPRGGVVVVGCAGPGATRSPAIAIRDPGPNQRFRLERPPVDMPLPDGCSETNVAAFEQGNKTGLLITPAAPPAGRETDVLRFDGQTWTREPIRSESFGEFRVVGLGATGLDNAWLSARASDRGVVLFQRVGNEWVEQSVPDESPLKNRTNPALGIVDVEPLGYPAESVSVSASGVWVDGRVRLDTGVFSYTLFRFPDGSVRSFCDATASDGASVCDRPLGAELSTQRGYRSFAFAGPGEGTRVITNPLREAGAEDTNRGTYLTFSGGAFRRVPGAGGDGTEPPGGAFAAIDRGWLGGNAGSAVEITRSPRGSQLQAFPVPFRRPLGAVAPEPGRPIGDQNARAIAVGQDGTAARFYPGRGWDPEPLLEPGGQRARPDLRGVAWPEQARAHAVGDDGEMWLWRADTGLWERDEATPEEFDGNLLAVAFDPNDAERGYSVGRGGILLRYDKTWTQEPLPVGVRSAEITSVAFAGRQAVAAALSLKPGSQGGVLVNDGGGWRLDAQAGTLIQASGARITAVAGLPDGGAVAAGPGIVIVRDSARGPWRRTDQPVSSNLNPVAAGAVREGRRVRAVVSLTRNTYPDDPDPTRVDDPSQPVPPLQAFALPAEGFVLRETAGGFRDEQRQAFRPSGPDLPVNPDPILGFALDSQGRGWAVGGETGERLEGAPKRVQTAGIYRYPSAGTPPAGTGVEPAPQRRGRARLIVAGHAQCERACADLARLAIGPDRGLSTALGRAGQLGGPTGPRAFLYTGARVSGAREGLNPSEAERFAALARPSPLPFFPSISEGTAKDNAAGFRSAFGGFGAPLGRATPRNGIGPVEIGAPAGPGARTHYAFDTLGEEGTVRVVVIDNSAGSLAASNAYQNPREPQEPWLRSVLRDARSQGIPAVVVGSRDLNSRVTPSNRASDADLIARLLVAEGASAYFFDRPEENRAYRIPAGGSQTIPSFASGTLGYTNELDVPEQFGESGMLLTEIDVARRDPSSNRAPVSVRLIPVLEDLAINSLDGTVLRRSRPALFEALARRPRAGIRNPEFSGRAPDPYVPIPPQICRGPNCATRIEPEYRFQSSRPDIGNFVRRDPASSNLRDVLLGANDKPVADSRSGLFCPFNSGTTRVTVKTGNLTFTQNVTVQGGAVRRPCGTVPRTDLPPRDPRVELPEIPPAESPEPGQPNVQLPPPLPPAPVFSPVLFPLLPEARVPAPTKPRPSPTPPVPLSAATAFFLPVIVPPPAPPAGRPTPPSGVGARVYQVEREEEEEAALEESQAASSYRSDEPPLLVPLGFALLVLAAAAGSTIARPRRRVRPAPVDLGPRRGSGR